MKTLCLDENCDRGMRRDTDLHYADTVEGTLTKLGQESWERLEIWIGHRQPGASEKIVAWINEHPEHAPKEVMLANIDPLEEVRIRINATIPVNKWGL